MNARATDTYERIWRKAREIPRGHVATYGQIADLAGFPRQARLAGYALHALTKGTTVPWHRVLNAQGRLSFPPHSRAYREQRRRLEAEGVTFMAGRVDLARYGWLRSLDEQLWAPAARRPR